MGSRSAVDNISGHLLWLIDLCSRIRDGYVIKHIIEAGLDHKHLNIAVKY